MEINDIINTIESPEARQSLREAMALQELEGNPLTKEDIEQFVMFEREGWSHEKRREHILNQFKNLQSKNPSYDEQRRTGPDAL